MDSFGTWTHFTSFVVTLIAILDPFMAIPFYIAICARRSAEQRLRIARLAVLTVMGVLIGAAVSGEAVLLALGTTLASFRIAGGLVLLLMALAMLQAKPGEVRQTAAEANAADEQEMPGIVPLAVPLLAGPGAISTVIIAAQHGGWHNEVMIVVAIVIVCALLWLMLRLAEPIGRMMGTTGFNVATRLLGLLLAAIAVEFMAAGLKELFPVLTGK
jgi:multiple antibiotic resistance protein